MTKRRKGACTAVAAAAALVLAGCGSSSGAKTASAPTTATGSPAAASASTTAPASTKTPTSVTLGYVGALPGFTPEDIMQQNPTMCTPYGVNVKVSSISDPASGEAAVVTGDLNMIMEANTNFVIGAGKSAGSTVAVAGNGPPDLELFASKGITSISDLKGKTVGTSTEGSLSDLALRTALGAAGLTAHTDYNETFSGSVPAYVGEIASGAISAMTITPPLPSAVTSAGVHELESLVKNTSYIPVGIITVVANKGFLTKNSAAVTGVLQCISAANKVALQNKSKALSAMEAALKIPAAKAMGDLAPAKFEFNLFPYKASYEQAAIAALEKYHVATVAKFSAASSIDAGPLAKVTGAQQAPS